MTSELWEAFACCSSLCVMFYISLYYFLDINQYPPEDHKKWALVIFILGLVVAIIGFAIIHFFIPFEIFGLGFVFFSIICVFQSIHIYSKAKFEISIDDYIWDRFSENRCRIERIEKRLENMNAVLTDLYVDVGRLLRKQDEFKNSLKYLYDEYYRNKKDDDC